MTTNLEWAALAAEGRLLSIDFPIHPRARRTLGEPAGGPLLQKLEARSRAYLEHIETLRASVYALTAIPARSANDLHWENEWIPALDGLCLYGFVSSRKPRRYFEVGSGTSTRFVRRAISDGDLGTRVISIDPQPRSEIDALCDITHRAALEDIDLGVFDEIEAGDIIFFDGSHRAFQNSDVVVFLTEVVPNLPPDVLIGLHDIFLPWDYPAEWTGRYYNEQYLLTCYLLGGEALRIEFPSMYVALSAPYREQLVEIWNLLPATAGANRTGGGFWMSTTDQLHPLNR